MTDKEQAATEALAAHDALKATYDDEPQCDDEGMPIDEGAWLLWKREVNDPAYARWNTAMNKLSVALGYEVGRHPTTFRPICDEVLSHA